MHRTHLRWRCLLWTLVVGLVMLARIADAGSDPQAPTEPLTPASDTRALRVLPTQPASASVRDDPTASGANLPQLVVQLGHANLVTSGAFSPDGTYVLTGSHDQTALLWDVATGRELRRFVGHGLWITAVAYSPDGQYALTGSMDRTARLWNIATGHEIARFAGHTDTVGAVAFAPDGASLLTASWDSTARLWDVASGALIRELQGHTAGIGAAAFAPDGAYILTGSSDTTARLWDICTGAEVRQFTGHPNGITTVAYAPDGHYVHTGSEVRRFAVFSEEELTQPTSAEQFIQSVAFSPNGQYALTVSRSKVLHIWAVDTGQEVGHMRSQVTLSMAVFAPDGQHVLMNFGDNAGVLDLTSGKLVARFTIQAFPVHAVAYASNGKYVATASTDRTARLWDLESGQQLHVFAGHTGTVFALAFSPDSTLLLTGGLDEAAMLWDVASGRLIHKLPGHARAVLSVMFSPDGQYALTGSGDAAHLWDVRSGEAIRTFASDLHQVERATFAFDGQYVVTLEGEKLIRFWATATGEQQHYLFKESERIQALAVAPDGRSLLVGMLGGQVQLLDVVSGDTRVNFAGHALGISAVTFSPDGQYVLTGGWDKTARLWDRTSGQELRRFASANLVQTVAFSPDGRYVVSSGDDAITRFWDVTTGQELGRLVAFADHAWVVTSPQGHFDTDDLEDITGLHWLVPDDPLQPLPIELFMRDYYEPRLLPRALHGEHFRHTRTLSELNRVQPPVRFVSVERQNETDLVTVTVEVATATGVFKQGGNPITRTTGVYDLRLFRDGQLVGTWTDGTAQPLVPSTDVQAELLSWRQATQVKLDDNGRRLLTFANIRLPRRTDVQQVVFSAYAFNEDRVKSRTARQSFTIPPDLIPRQGRAYVISVGVNAYENPRFDLGFAANDARRLQHVVPAALARLQTYAEVVAIPLIADYETTSTGHRVTEHTATKPNVKAVLDLLAGRAISPASAQQIPHADKIQPARPEDLVVLSFASHGVADHDGTFYFITYDTGTERSIGFTDTMRVRAISSHELTAWLHDVDAGDMVLIVDACHSAATVDTQGFKPGPMGSRGLGQLAYDKGMQILASTQADDVALEFEQLEQGLLTYALTHDGLEAGQADFAPADKTIYLTEWLAYGAKRVAQLHAEIRSGALQTFGLEAGKRGFIVARSSDAPSPDGTQGTQRPSLFNFARKKHQVTLLHLP